MQCVRVCIYIYIYSHDKKMKKRDQNFTIPMEEDCALFNKKCG